MRVLVVGAGGFIGSTIVAVLVEAGFDVRASVRDPVRFRRRFPAVAVARADLTDPASHAPDHWRPALEGCDALVNAAGVLQPRRERDAWAVHRDAPAALFAACEAAGVRRVVQISAVGVDEADTLFARSKRAGDQALMARDLDWTVLRPAIVVGEGSYGGTSMLRAMAAFPFVTPVIGSGATPADFIHKQDLAAAIVRLLAEGRARRTILAPASAERLTLADAARAYRRWLGLADRPLLKVPLPLARTLGRIGDLTRLEPVTTTALAQLEARLTGEPDAFAAATGVTARTLSEVLAARPAETQDLWHARLYLARPLVRLALAVMWLVSGVVGLLADPARYAALVAPFGIGASGAHLLGLAASAIDLAIAAALVAGWRLKQMALVQLCVVAAYTIGLTVAAPALWGDLFGALLKNLPVLALILVHRVLEEER